MTKVNEYCKQAIEINKVAYGDKVDMINHPKHYCREDAIECLDEMRLVFGDDIVAAFCLCNVWKYRYRAASKGQEEDLKKSDFYMRKYKELITQRNLLGIESTTSLEELKDIVKETLDKWYLERVNENGNDSK